MRVQIEFGNLLYKVLDMPLVEPLSPDTDDDVRKLSEFFQGPLGFTPNSILTMQRRPEIAKAFIALRGNQVMGYILTGVVCRAVIRHDRNLFQKGKLARKGSDRPQAEQEAPPSCEHNCDWKGSAVSRTKIS